MRKRNLVALFLVFVLVCFLFELHDGGPGFRLNDSPNIKLSSDVCLSFVGPTLA